jgi:hypothetical protein
MVERMREPADGTKGILLRVDFDKWVFRVYKENNYFIDYDLLHSDLQVTIDDADSTFYSDDKGNRLDHNPETLGIK